MGGVYGGRCGYRAEMVLTVGGRGTRAASLELTVNVYNAAGDLVATTSGPNQTEMSIVLTAGSYTWEVTGARTSFSLAVTYMPQRSPRRRTS